MLEGDRYIVTWALGHLVTLADPEEYDRKYEKWEIEAPCLCFRRICSLVVIRQTAKQYRGCEDPALPKRCETR